MMEWVFIIFGYILGGLITGGCFSAYSDCYRIVSAEKQKAQSILSGIFWPLAVVWFLIFWAIWVFYYAFKQECRVRK